MSGVHDTWLTQYYGGLLAEVDARCRREDFDPRWLRGLDDDAWVILLGREYDVYPALREALPELPPAAMQETWNGRSGLELATQSADFYRKLKGLQARHGAVALPEASAVLDFGCGWGRLIRLLWREVEPGALCGCDPDPSILEVCADTRVPGRLEFSAAVPDALPFDDRFDLVYAFSVFTHLSEPAHLACLRAIHAGLVPGGLLIATVRPPAYVDLGLDVGRVRLGGDDPAYAFVGHGGALPDYGEAVLNMPYVRERWGELFELCEVSLMLDDMYQVILTLRRR